MKQKDRDAGTIAALMIRFEEYRLPRAKRLLQRVRAGETLSDSDLAFLERVVEDGRGIQPLVARHPEYRVLVSKMLDLYGEIISKSLENEKNRG